MIATHRFALPLFAIGMISLAGCQEQVASSMPPPVAMTEEAVGHFCQMNILEHPGPKAQIHLDRLPHPLFFSQVRDGVAYERMPEQNYEIVAVYVSDMSRAPDWENVGTENWIPANSAHYVVGSSKAGGMGSPELVPFSDRNDALAFVRQYGGQVMTLDQIDDVVVLSNAAATPQDTDELATVPDDADYRNRLEKLRKQ